MTKILQYGQGNFLRAFADTYFNTLNEEGGDYSVTVIKPIPMGDLSDFDKQNNVYHTVLRGSKDGRSVEDVYRIEVLDKVLSPFEDPDSYYALARDPELKIIVSNTTEAGICFNGDDDINGFEDITYPAKLTKFLLERFRAGLGGVYLLPVELIDNNADVLRDCVGRYIELWDLPETFKIWNEKENYYCNTLVDRIVSGYPRDIETKERLTALIGENDALMTIGEPFGLWAIENKGDIADYVKEGKHNIEVVLTNDIGYYKKRKVRVLNGSHTNLVPAGLWEGEHTVYDCMMNEKLRSFLLETLENEIVPFVSNDINATKVFADSVLDRFANPYLNHQLTSIALNSISKWRARNLPSFKDYYEKHGVVAPNMTKGFAYLMQLYRSVSECEGKYVASLPSRKIEVVDDKPYLDYFVGGGSVEAFMKDEKVWGEDLTAYEGFLSSVLKYVKALENGESLI